MRRRKREMEREREITLISRTSSIKRAIEAVAKFMQIEQQLNDNDSRLLLHLLPLLLLQV